jgi:hypothetical protein
LHHAGRIQIRKLGGRSKIDVADGHRLMAEASALPMKESAQS